MDADEFLNELEAAANWSGISVEPSKAQRRAAYRLGASRWLVSTLTADECGKLIDALLGGTSGKS